MDTKSGTLWMTTFWPPRLMLGISNALSSHGRSTVSAGLSSDEPAAMSGGAAGAFPSVTTVTSVPPSWIRAFRPSSSEQVVMKVCEPLVPADCSSAWWSEPPPSSALSCVSRTACVSRLVSELWADMRGWMGVSKLTCWSTMSWFSGLSRTTLVLFSLWIPPGMMWFSWFRDADMMILSCGLQ